MTKRGKYSLAMTSQGLDSLWLIDWRIRIYCIYDRTDSKAASLVVPDSVIRTRTCKKHISPLEFLADWRRAANGTSSSPPHLNVCSGSAASLLLYSFFERTAFFFSNFSMRLWLITSLSDTMNIQDAYTTNENGWFIACYRMMYHYNCRGIVCIRMFMCCYWSVSLARYLGSCNVNRIFFKERAQAFKRFLLFPTMLFMCSYFLMCPQIPHIQMYCSLELGVGSPASENIPLA